MTSWLLPVVKVRFLVGHLGETGVPPLWRSDATSAVSRRFLERLYPRTFLAASLDVVAHAASIEHDAHISTAGTYHLFRLPVAYETAIHEFLHSSSGNEQLALLANLTDRDAYMSALDQVAHDSQPSGSYGPVACGSMAELQAGGAVRRMSAVYVQGFVHNRPVYPYLTKDSA